MPVAGKSISRRQVLRDLNDGYEARRELHRMCEQRLPGVIKPGMSFLEEAMRIRDAVAEMSKALGRPMERG